jgi:aerobic-type carbon monoxide dehydrogenase small subunit (CoxS/CutS family)
MARIILNINGKKTAVDVDSSVSLLSVLRDSLDLTGTKYGPPAHVSLKSDALWENK